MKDFCPWWDDSGKYEWVLDNLLAAYLNTPGFVDGLCDFGMAEQIWADNEGLA